MNVCGGVIYAHEYRCLQGQKVSKQIWVFCKTSIRLMAEPSLQPLFRVIFETGSFMKPGDHRLSRLD